MRKTVYIFLAVLTAVLALTYGISVKVSAQSVEDSTESINGYLDDSSGGIMTENGISVSGGDVFSGLDPSGIFSWISDKVHEYIRAPFSMFAVLLSVILLTSVFSGLCVSSDRTCSRSADIVSVLTALAASAGPVGECMASASGAINDGSLFMLAFIPVMTTVTAVSGGAVTAGSYSLITVAFCEAASEFSSCILMPSVSLCMCISVIDAVNPEFSLQGLLQLLRRGVNLMLGLIMTVFAGLLTLENIAGSTADSVAVKTGKFLVSNLVPAVGRSVSDACSAVYGSIGILRTGVGTAGIAVSILTAAVPLIRLFLFRFALMTAGAAADLMGCVRIKKLLGDLETVLGMVISIVVVFLVMLTVSTAMTMKMISV